MPVRLQTAERNVLSVKNRWIAVALVPAAVFAALAWTPGVARAEPGRGHHHAADVTFTKWVTSEPADPSTLAGVLMAGVVGGDVGHGRYAGQVISDDTATQPGFWLGHSRYEFHGRKHSFIADVRITENDTTVPITAMIEGTVVKGWLRGASVTGEYTQFDTCPIPTPGNVFGTTCFQGTLHLQLHRH